MPVAAAHNVGVGTNLPLARSLYFSPAGLEDLPRREAVEEAESLSPARLQAVASLEEARALAEEISTDLSLKPARLALELHRPAQPSLLGSAYV